MPAFDILQYYPQSGGRSSLRVAISEEQREVSRRFDFDYFDGERQYGYGGYSYHPRFWTDTVQHIAGHYSLDNSSSILDVGCAKGFMLKDLQILLPGTTLAGVDISDYAIGHAEHEVKELVRVACATDLPFANDSFDLVLSINTLHNLDRSGCIKALGEVERVSKRDACVVVDGWSTDAERDALHEWVLTPKTMLHVSDWKMLFAEAGYTGDYAFWTPA